MSAMVIFWEAYVLRGGQMSYIFAARTGRCPVAAQNNEINPAPDLVSAAAAARPAAAWRDRLVVKWIRADQSAAAGCPRALAQRTNSELNTSIVCPCARETNCRCCRQETRRPAVLYIHLYSPVGRSIHNIKRNNKPKNTQNLN